MPWIVLAVVGVVLLAHTAPFPFLVDALDAGRVVWRMPPRGTPPAVYLTFDDGPNPRATPRVLDALQRHGARATFFLIERHLDDDTVPLVRRMFDEGHGVALHSGNRWLMARSTGALADHLVAFRNRIGAMTGRLPCKAFRPHGGNRSLLMTRGLARIDHQLIGWGWFGWDWSGFRARRGEAVAARLARRASDGFIMVVHDGHHANRAAARQHAADTVDHLVPALRARGFEFRTICEDLGAVQRAAARRSP